MRDQRSEPARVVSVVNGSDDTTGSLTGSNLAQGVGLGLSLSLAVEGVGQEGRDVVRERHSTHLSDSGLGSVGDNTNVVKTTLSYGVLHWLSCCDLSNSPGLGVPGDCHHYQA